MKTEKQISQAIFDERFMLEIDLSGGDGKEAVRRKRKIMTLEWVLEE